MKTFDDIPEASIPKSGWQDGETVPPDASPLKIERAKIVEKSVIMEFYLNKEQVDDRLLFIDHPTRIFLYWMILPSA